MMVITFLVRRRPDVPDAEFHRYWREEHGPLVASHAEALGIRRYSQLHNLDSPIGAAVAQSRECEPTTWDGIALVWFDDEASLIAATTTPEGGAAGAALLEDERRFLDLPRCQIFLSEDHAVIG
jgi:uncharacterized protein (TIGR02118 family)